MRPLDVPRWGRLTLAIALVWVAAGAGAADTSGDSAAPPPLTPPAAPANANATADEPDLALTKALQLEREHHWSDAIQVYQDALDHWPDRVEFRHRLRLCEAHFKLNRRYQDRSFRGVLLKLSREQAMDLYDEVLERIELHYVEPVALDPLLRRGFDNLEVALRDPVFLAANASSIPADRIQWLRSNMLARRQQVHARSRADARAHVLAACEQARVAANLPPAAVILEFTYGSCDALDDYSSYLTPDRLDDLYAMIDGNFVGLGVELKLDNDGLKLVGVLRGGPASEAGMKVGDHITQIDGRPVQGLDLDTAANRLQGAEGSAVAITLLRADGSTPTLKLVRRPVEVRSVAEAKLIDHEAGVGYIQLAGFQKTSTDEIRAAVADLQKQGMRQLVLDLRGNPGGLLNVAVEIADRFLDQGIIVSTRGRALGQSALYRARADGAWTMPVFILVDHDSASASEILAGALQENGRAVVVGERSYGKGSVQSIFPLRSVSAGLKLTTAKFFSPRNRAYSEQGVEPDVRVTTAARPVRGDRSSLDFPVGDPERDPVLRTALRLANKR
jgi:carboxyl-terminal processing protease